MGNKNESSTNQNNSSEIINSDQADSKTYYEIDEQKKTLAYN